MTTYNFKKETKVYVVLGGLRYTLDVYPDLSFSQTFNETSVPVKTLHSQFDMFENAVIVKANPANFNFTIPILLDSDIDVVLKLLRDYSSSGATLDTADLYIQSNTETYKLEAAVVESGTFQLMMNAPLTLNASGTARKLSKFTGALPGTLQSRTARRFSRISSMRVTLDNVDQPYITAVSIELKNNVQWVDFATLQKSTSVSSASDTMYPEAFVVSNRTLSGVVQQYITDETNTNVNKWSTSSSLGIRIVSEGNSAIKFLIPSVVYTNRMEIQDVLVQSYDFRMNTNPSDLSSVIVK